MLLVLGAVLGMLYGVVAMCAITGIGKRRVYWLLVLLVVGCSLLGFFAWKW